MREKSIFHLIRCLSEELCSKCHDEWLKVGWENAHYANRSGPSSNMLINRNKRRRGQEESRFIHMHAH